MAAIPAGPSSVQFVVMWPRPRLDRLADDALLTAVGLDDVDAAAVFVRRFQRRVFGLALTITTDPATAEDVAQQAFERAWRHAAAYDPRRGSVATWLLTITRNLSIDAIRVRRPQPLDPDLLRDLLPGDDADPADAAAHADRLGPIRQALAALPPAQCRAVVLATIGARTSSEIAALEGVPVPTAKHRVQSGLRKLRERLEAEADA
jgi:RNA polymerase sigma factor (sigma-70 family)